MKIIKRENRVIETEVDVICNKCGSLCYVTLKGYLGVDKQGLSTMVEVKDDYDDQRWAFFDLCRPCTEELMAGFKHPVEWEQ